MFKVALNCNSSPFFSKKQLMNLKTKALRSGVWFKALQRIDRVLIDLTIRVLDNIRSNQLAKSIIGLMSKLENSLKGSFSFRLNELGLPMSQKISSIAQRLGNLSASNWLFDSSFAVFLAIMQISNIKILRR